GYLTSVDGQTLSTSAQVFNMGTSAVAPLYAGLVACLNAYFEKPIGFLNPTLYELGNRVCRDITSGNNLWGGPDNCATQFYSAARGWDAGTGGGFVAVFALLNALSPILNPPPPDPCTNIIQRLDQALQVGIPVSAVPGWKAQLLSCLERGKITEAEYTAA